MPSEVRYARRDAVIKRFTGIEEEIRANTKRLEEKIEKLEEELKYFKNETCTRASDNFHINRLTESTNKLWESHKKLEEKVDVIKKELEHTNYAPEFIVKLIKEHKDKDKIIKDLKKQVLAFKPTFGKDWTTKEHMKTDLTNALKLIEEDMEKEKRSRKKRMKQIGEE